MSQKLRIMLDVDGVLYDFEGAAREILNTEFGYDLHQPSPYWNYLKDRVEPEHWNALWSPEKYGQRLFGQWDTRAMPGVEYAREFNRYELVIATKKPHWALEYVAVFLDMWAIAPRELHLLPAKARKSAIRPVCDVYIDDSPEVIGDLADNTQGTILVFEQPWNNDPVMHGLDEVRDFEYADGWAYLVKRVHEIAQVH